MIEFADQPLASRIMRAALERESPPQQLLLHGPAGTGKREAALEIAWALMDPAGEHARTGDALDLTVMEALGTQILREDVGATLTEIAARPQVMRRRVLVVHDAERLTNENGAPRMLKSLEEPAPRSHIILVTDRPGELLDTIRSRCLPVPFRNPGWRAVAARLEAAGEEPALAASRARAEGTSALEADAFTRAMRQVGVDLGVSALRGDGAPGERLRAAQRAMEDAAAGSPSVELERLRAEAAALEGKRGGRTAAKRAEDQEKRERRRMISDGWGLVLTAAAGMAADALAVSVGAPGTVRHAERVADVAEVAVPERQAFLIRAIEELQQARANLKLNPRADLAAEVMLVRIDAARHGGAGPLVPPGRLAYP